MPRGGSRMGAGRPGRSIKVEDCRRLDVREMQRAGLFKTAWIGSWTWRDALSGRVTSSVSVLTKGHELRLSYICDKIPCAVTVSLSAVRCGFGGLRQMFVCPKCQHRCFILLLLRRQFRCRECHDVPYSSQAQDALGRTWITQCRLERHLDGEYRRPKGMHMRTYKSLRKKIMELEIRREDLLDEVVTRWL